MSASSALQGKLNTLYDLFYEDVRTIYRDIATSRQEAPERFLLSTECKVWCGVFLPELYDICQAIDAEILVTSAAADLLSREVTRRPIPRIDEDVPLDTTLRLINLCRLSNLQLPAITNGKLTGANILAAYATYTVKGGASKSLAEIAGDNGRLSLEGRGPPWAGLVHFGPLAYMILRLLDSTVVGPAAEAYDSQLKAAVVDCGFAGKTEPMFGLVAKPSLLLPRKVGTVVSDAVRLFVCIQFLACADYSSGVAFQRLTSFVLNPTQVSTVLMHPLDASRDKQHFSIEALPRGCDWVPWAFYLALSMNPPGMMSPQDTQRVRDSVLVKAVGSRKKSDEQNKASLVRNETWGTNDMLTYLANLHDTTLVQTEVVSIVEGTSKKLSTHGTGNAHYIVVLHIPPSAWPAESRRQFVTTQHALLLSEGNEQGKWTGDTSADHDYLVMPQTPPPTA